MGCLKIAGKASVEVDPRRTAIDSGSAQAQAWVLVCTRCRLRSHHGPLRGHGGVTRPLGHPAVTAPQATIGWYVLAAIAEIAGCFAFWAVLRLERSPSWLTVGVLSLIVFAYALTRVEAEAAGRAFAAYGGIYIVASLVWLKVIEGVAPDRWDILGGLICLGGAALILWGPGRG